MNDNEKNQSGSHPTSVSTEHDQYLKERSVRLKISTLVISFIFIVGTTWRIIDIYEIEDLKYEIANLKSEKENVNTQLKQKKIENDELSYEYEKLKKSYSEIGKTRKIPILASPVNRYPIIGRHITFSWKYSTDPGFQNLILELVKIEGNETKERRFQIPEPGKESTLFEFPEGISGEFFWRIGTGELLNDQEGTRLWSRFGSFSVYPSVRDKIKKTKSLTVGTMAKFLSYDHPMDCEGKPISYDFDFVRWIGGELSAKLGLERNIIIRQKYLKWEGGGLYKGVINGDVDIAIASITKSKKREKNNPGLVFTVGYRDNNQTFIRKKKKGDNPDMNVLIKDIEGIKKLLNGKTVTAQKETINMEVANLLFDSGKFGLKKVQEGYSSYADVMHAVHQGKVDYGIIDSVRWNSVAHPELENLNIDLNPFLQKFYETLGTDHEQYAIAASAKLCNKSFVNLLNKIIDSDDGKKMRSYLQKKHKPGGDINRTTDLFQCDW